MNGFLRSALSGVALACLAGASASADSFSNVYLSAHPDDFVLFQHPYRDVTADNTRVVFIFVTAGDAGLGVGPTNAPYYLARENAVIKSIRFMADASRPWAEGATTGTISVNGHSIYRMAYRSTVAYFLRLPDGNGDGNGFPGTGNVSIAKLRSGAISTLRAINGSTTYSGWTDFVRTISAIVTREATGSSSVTLHANDTDSTRNPGDHLDHLITGAAAAQTQTLLPCVKVAYYVGYSLAGVSNLSQADALDKSGSFAAYATGLTDKNYFGAWDDTHKSWLNGLQWRTVNGNGRACAF
jgi:hypothetical protein